jgi:UDP-2,3-diacylglucosamine pyrophosphatase LpxH
MKQKSVVEIKCDFKPRKILLISDLHWDNPHCDRELLKSHLDQAVAGGHDILINGDLFCAMQGKYDGRRSKSDIRPEHNNSKYLDALVETAAEWFAPYAQNIKVIGYGNHETSILKHCETDLIERFVTLLNANTKSLIEIGGYGGWIIYRMNRVKESTISFKIKYFHGSGGGGVVTKGSIQFNRMMAMVEGADAIWMGHVHESMEMTYTMERITNADTVALRDVLMIRTPAYKEEYQDGSKGWHIERGAPPKPLGGRWLELHPSQNKVRSYIITAHTYKTN